jgi:hypothetical protein
MGCICSSSENNNDNNNNHNHNTNIHSNHGSAHVTPGNDALDNNNNNNDNETQTHTPQAPEIKETFLDKYRGSKLDDLSEEEITTIWDNYDVNQDGKLEKKEIDRVCQDVLTLAMNAWKTTVLAVAEEMDPGGEVRGGDDTIQYNTIQYNTIQYITIQYNTILHRCMHTNIHEVPMYTLYTIHYTLHTIPYTLYTIHYTPYTIHRVS